MSPSLRNSLLAVAACLASVSANPLPNEDKQCTTTVPVFPTFTFGPVRTIYTTTSTATRTVDCGNCAHVKEERVHLGPGPVVFFTTTTTAKTPAVTHVYACAKAAEAVPTPE